MLTITIDRHAPPAVYAQVAHQIRALITTGALAPTTPLPSVRQLASDLTVSLNTVARAYRLLESEGFLHITGRTGVTVAAPAKKVENTTCKALLHELRALLAKLRQAGMGKREVLRIVGEEVKAMDAAGTGRTSNKESRK